MSRTPNHTPIEIPGNKTESVKGIQRFWDWSLIIVVDTVSRSRIVEVNNVKKVKVYGCGVLYDYTMGLVEMMRVV